MKDALGQAIDGGDEVVFLESRYRALQLGTVMYATPRGARIMPHRNNNEVNRVSSYFIKHGSGDE